MHFGGGSRLLLGLRVTFAEVVMGTEVVVRRSRRGLLECVINEESMLERMNE